MNLNFFNDVLKSQIKYWETISNDYAVILENSNQDVGKLLQTKKAVLVVRSMAGYKIISDQTTQFFDFVYSSFTNINGATNFSNQAVFDTTEGLKVNDILYINNEYQCIHGISGNTVTLGRISSYADNTVVNKVTQIETSDRVDFTATLRLHVVCGKDDLNEGKTGTKDLNKAIGDIYHKLRSRYMPLYEYDELYNVVNDFKETIFWESSDVRHSLAPVALDDTNNDYGKYKTGNIEIDCKGVIFREFVEEDFITEGKIIV